MIKLHWLDGIITIQGVPKGYNYLVAYGHSVPGPIPKERHVVLAAAKSDDIKFPLAEGNFTFRARTPNPDLPNYEFENTTGILPVELFHKKVSRWIKAANASYIFTECNYRQIECVEGLDELPDPRTNPVPR